MKDYDLLVKHFYMNGKCAFAAFRSLKGMKKRLWYDVCQKSEEYHSEISRGAFFIGKSRRRRKSITSTSVEDVH